MPSRSCTVGFHVRLQSPLRTGPPQPLPSPASIQAIARRYDLLLLLRHRLRHYSYHCFLHHCNRSHHHRVPHVATWQSIPPNMTSCAHTMQPMDSPASGRRDRRTVPSPKFAPGQRRRGHAACLTGACEQVGHRCINVHLREGLLPVQQHQHDVRAAHGRPCWRHCRAYRR